MKNKRISKRQILLGVCCLLFFIGILTGSFLSIKNEAEIVISGSAEHQSFIRGFFDIFKFTALSLICGLVPEISIFLYLLVAYKGFSIGYTAFAISEANILKRLLVTASFVPAELILSFFIIFCASYFPSYKKPVYTSKGYHQDTNKRKTEIIILVISGLIISIICALWKNSAVYILYKTP
ncbi:MAG: hypothetical protein E7235_02925 [Lachnospiraceae bacterium]|nr:hypothetical protein [Lachnospiraceae bacterium]